MGISITNKRVFRENFFIDAAKNKRVLDIGCAAADGLQKLHSRIKDEATYTVGIDQQEGEGIIVCDAQNFTLDEKFDVCIAGEVIEHLGNVSGFLKSCSQAVGKNGRVIISTPNPYSLVSLRYAIFGRKIPNDPTHVSLYDVTTFKNMLEIYMGDSIVSGEIHYYEELWSQSPVYRLNKLFSRFIKPFSCGILADLTIR
ncbi:MAG: methyltransferase domain-containing protein [Gammaproteobacteria bacterium]|nr:methyltransferase domain-containing protein [Gammaproteobacteria bacterium]